MLSDLHAIVLGVVQGATEWLPISSTAHLRIIPALLGWPDPGAAFTAVIQLGTLLAALVYFRMDIVRILATAHSEDPNEPDRRMLIPILVGTLPVVVFGFALRHQIEGSLRSLYVVAGSVIAFALLLALAEGVQRKRRGLETITLADGLAVGFGQAFALMPGASRSGTTITAALFSGIERSAAARFSFLLSLPAVFLAGVYELWHQRHALLSVQEFRPLVIATLISFLVGWASIYWFLSYLRRHPTYAFVAYRLLLGAAILALLFSARLDPMAGEEQPGNPVQGAVAAPAASRP